MSRNLDFKDETYSEYALAIGRLILVWNDLHMVLSDTFHAVTKIPNGMATDAIWNSITSDRAQREMIKNLVSLSAISYDLRGDLKAQLVWTLNKIVSLEQVRNDVIHAPIMVDQNGAI